MDSIIQILTANKIVLIIAILIASLIVYSILKSLLKIIVIVIIALALYLGYMNYRGENIEPKLSEYLNRGGKELNELKKKLDSALVIKDQAEKIRN